MLPFHQLKEPNKPDKLNERYSSCVICPADDICLSGVIYPADDISPAGVISASRVISPSADIHGH